ncbi:formate dehydrogenase accessory sulfurtransferase FdhD [Paracoccus sp. 1_MG-2023]|uniref:formate dehydrogenase accessory sulfurtransferase FdhD n=1 Tax=unclassified Paracoccus (in: a-proteobacteria) TaxID=2688777 RepID=UPI001C0918F8|nr:MULTISPECIES: formate dehydrogenase accessory sulfurtransferase FdhD [unclassified Paracoccus (in: a-proteobacteria)]MBU2958617.1 formate dehydrogenase accessory sulfurtransferase FdhD [Paracoccus sp. C2R09]MDO6667610.1 formate dehydrogenase accessory sulfurtransferase FdhD [Paracoccus sp. 1_MG-2023]
MIPHPFAAYASVRHPDRSPGLRDLPEETPIAMVYHGSTHAVMMASPQDIEDFATGFTLTEGVVDEAAQIEEIRVVAHDAGIEAQMWLSGDRGDRLAARRRSMAGPVGCGLCGIESLSSAIRDLPRVTGVGIPASEVAGATDALRQMQPLHDATRAVHAAGFLLPGQGIVMAREDVGRHNALDKLIGAMARQGMDARQGAIVLTSRVSVEMVQKTAMAGAGVLIAVSAPTAHALRLADGAGLTVAALARGGGFDLFSHPHRITGTE